jgi:hypothetical protein
MSIYHETLYSTSDFTQDGIHHHKRSFLQEERLSQLCIWKGTSKFEIGRVSFPNAVNLDSDFFFKTLVAIEGPTLRFLFLNLSKSTKRIEDNLVNIKVFLNIHSKI